MRTETWTDIAWSRARGLSTRMREDGFRPKYPNTAMARVDDYIYGSSKCVRSANGGCRGIVILFPFWDGKHYQLYSVCMKCGDVKRKGGGV